MPQRERYISQEERIYDCKSKIQEQSKTSFNTQKPEVGEIWYIRIRDAIGVSTMRVKDLTEYTVLLIEPKNDCLSIEGTRYTFNDIEFIEKVKK